ncbi:hypothetical protein MPSEU_001009600 [Mayamaea pseudoterrestris]|nr:hypothetical protein MPSEU_001009600 [Mayamaea pseudoterrestris]
MDTCLPLIQCVLGHFDKALQQLPLLESFTASTDFAITSTAIEANSHGTLSETDHSRLSLTNTLDEHVEEKWTVDVLELNSQTESTSDSLSPVTVIPRENLVAKVSFEATLPSEAKLATSKHSTLLDPRRDALFMYQQVVYFAPVQEVAVVSPAVTVTPAPASLTTTTSPLPSPSASSASLDTASSASTKKKKNPAKKKKNELTRRAELTKTLASLVAEKIAMHEMEIKVAYKAVKRGRTWS